jgi:hypothetical protein
VFPHLAEAAAERNADGLRPALAPAAWFWRELLVASSAGADKRLHELLLEGFRALPQKLSRSMLPDIHAFFAGDVSRDAAFKEERGVCNPWQIVRAVPANQIERGAL